MVNSTHEAEIEAVVADAAVAEAGDPANAESENARATVVASAFGVGLRTT